MATAPTPLPTDQLIDLYKISVEEYRFEVKLNWDRTAYYLTLNSGLIAVAAGLLKLDSSAPLVDLLVGAVFFIGVCVSAIGIAAIRKGHNYYRRTIVKKTLIEDHLGLTRVCDGYWGRPTLAIGTTFGQAEHLQILHNTEAWLKRGLRPRTVTFWIVAILCLFVAANTAGVVGSIWIFSHHRVPHEIPNDQSPRMRIVPIVS